jgi:phosphotransferase family enzyme
VKDRASFDRMQQATLSAFTPAPCVAALEEPRLPWWRHWLGPRPAAPRRTSPFLEELIEVVQREVGLPRGRLRIQRVAVARGRSVTCMLSDGEAAGWAAKVPMNGRALGRCDENLSVLGRIHSLGRLPPELALAIPRPVGRFVVGEQPVFVETSIPGAPGAGYGSIRRRRARGSALSFLTALHASSGEPAVMDDALFEDRVGHYCDRLASAFGDLRQEATIRRLREGLRARLGGRSFLMVAEHGDFHLGNCLFDEGGRRLGVIDWDLGACPGMPVLDALHLLVTSDGPGHLDADTASRVLGDGVAPESQDLLAEYMEAVGIERDARPAWRLLYVVVKLLVPSIAREGASRDRWREAVALPTLEVLAGSARP